MIRYRAEILANDSLEIVEVIIVKLDTMTASDMRMHQVLNILTLTFTQGHKDLNHGNNKCLIISETLRAMSIKFSVKIVQLKVCIWPLPIQWPWPSFKVTSASQTWLLFNFQYLGQYSSYYIQIWHGGRPIHGISYMLMLGSMTLTLMPGRSGSAKATTFQCWIILTTEQSTSVATICYNCRPFFFMTLIVTLKMFLIWFDHLVFCGFFSKPRLCAWLLLFLFIIEMSVVCADRKSRLSPRAAPLPAPPCLDLDRDFENVYIACLPFFFFCPSNPGCVCLVILLLILIYIIENLAVCRRKITARSKSSSSASSYVPWPWPWFWKRLYGVTIFFFFFFSNPGCVPGSYYSYLYFENLVVCRQKITAQSKSSASARSFMPVTLTMTLKTFI